MTKVSDATSIHVEGCAAINDSQEGVTEDMVEECSSTEGTEMTLTEVSRSVSESITTLER